MSKVIDATLRFVDRFTAPMNNAIRGMERSAKQSQRMGREIQKAGNSISKVGSSLTKSITLPIVGVAVAAIKTSNDFENSMAKVATIADTTKIPINSLKQQVVDLSNKVGVGVTDIAEAQYQAISAGVDTASSVEFVSTAVKAAKGGFTDTTTAVDGLTTVLNAYGLESSKAAEISDQMLIAQNYGKTTFGDMASSMGKVIPIASSLSVSTEELFSSFAVLTKNGIGTSEAVTGLKAAYSNILKPTKDASKAAENLGLDFSSAHLQSVGWAKFLEEIKEKTGGNADTMAKLFGSTEALNSVMVLAGKGSEDFTEAMGKMGEAGGATQEAYEKMITPSEKMNISINKIKNSLIKFGAALAPVFDKLSTLISGLGDKLNNLSEGQVNTITKFAGMAAAIGPGLMIFGKLTAGIGGAILKFGKLGGAISKAGGLIPLITSPAGIVIGVIAGIALAAFLIIKNWTKVKVFLGKLGSFIKGVFIKSGANVGIFAKLFTKAKNVISKSIENLRPAIKNIITFLTPVVKFLASVFIARIKLTFTIFGSVLSATINGVVGFVSGLLTVLEGITTFIGGVFTGDWKKAWEGIQTIFKGVFESFVALAKVPINAVIGLINGAISGINNLGLTIPDWVPLIGGKSFSINVPTIPMLYKGTNNWQGGTAMIHDRGAEIVDLPRGTRVYPHDKSIAMARAEGAAGSKGTVSISISKLADKIEVRSDKDIDTIVNKLADKFEKIVSNKGKVVPV